MAGSLERRFLPHSRCCHHDHHLPSRNLRCPKSLSPRDVRTHRRSIGALAHVHHRPNTFPHRHGLTMHTSRMPSDPPLKISRPHNWPGREILIAEFVLAETANVPSAAIPQDGAVAEGEGAPYFSEVSPSHPSLLISG